MLPEVTPTHRSQLCPDVPTYPPPLRPAAPLLQAAAARAARQPPDKRPHTVEEVLRAGGEQPPLLVPQYDCLVCLFSARCLRVWVIWSLCSPSHCRFSSLPAASELEHRESLEGRPHQRHSLASQAQVSR